MSDDFLSHNSFSSSWKQNHIHLKKKEILQFSEVQAVDIIVSTWNARKLQGLYKNLKE